MHGGAYEWNTLYNYKSANGSYKVPAMSLPLGQDGTATLFKDARGYESARALSNHVVGLALTADP